MALLHITHNRLSYYHRTTTTNGPHVPLHIAICTAQCITYLHITIFIYHTPISVHWFKYIFRVFVDFFINLKDTVALQNGNLDITVSLER